VTVQLSQTQQKASQETGSSMIKPSLRMVMDKVTIELENCYGIKKLHKEFDFSKDTVYAIYAPNGLMKSSLAHTFQDVAEGTLSTDRIFPDRINVRNITDENGTAIPGDSIFVVRPYDAAFAHSEKTSTLLVDAKLKKEYDQLQAAIETAKETLLQALKEQSGSKKNIEKEVSSTFTSTDQEFFTALTRVQKEIQDQKDAPFSTVVYDTIFSDKVLQFLETKDAKTAIDTYVKRYNELLAASVYFKKGTFDYYNAGKIAKSLAENGFFAASHTVNLKSQGKLLEINTQKELEAVIEKEKQDIIKDKALSKKFDEIATLLGKNETLREFQTYMMEHEGFLSQLSNIKKFKEDIWKSYLKEKFDLYSDLLTKYEAAASRMKQIQAEAAKQGSQWEDVIKIFNERFIVPFKLEAKNRTAVMLGYASMIELGFTYHDGAENVAIDKTKLMDVLSTGERKALYILNIIFEVEVRRKAKQKTIMVIDDIADSFDYQNKYAIIQYLRDINEDRLFKQIIMTHNFDFFRIINSRFVSYVKCLMALKSANGISLEQAYGIQNVFKNDWKTKFFTDRKKKIGSIPFIRNLVEFTTGDSDPKFMKMTSLLHWKSDSGAITVAELDAIYNQVFGGTGSTTNNTELVVDMIRSEADLCVSAGTGINFENKIVLSIAIRLVAEQYMVTKINDPKFWVSIKSNQTYALLNKFKKLFSSDTHAVEILDRVLLMTPENIHLNSFMYEPIMDMSDDHLRKLYTAVLGLK
jgi:hypothetical protein